MSCEGVRYWTDGEAPRCPEHPEIVLHLIEPFQVCVEAVVHGGRLHGLCFYGCEVVLTFKAHGA